MVLNNANNVLFGIRQVMKVMYTGKTIWVKHRKNLFDQSAIGPIIPNPANPSTVREGIVITNLEHGLYALSVGVPIRYILYYARFSKGVRIDSSARQVIVSDITRPNYALIDMSSCDEVRFWVSTDNTWDLIRMVQLEKNDHATEYEKYIKGE